MLKQNLDDIGFVLAKMDVLGKRLHKAASNKCFLAEFEKEPFRVRRRLSFITKSVYFFNLVVFVVGVSIISYKQTSGYYQCESVSVSFGDDIWDEAFVKNETNGFEEMVLVYSYFNGVYKQNGTHDGRPVYVSR